LTAANKIACARKDWSFRLEEILRELPQLNESTVRTHVVSRCCVNAPQNHLHKWPYFRRIRRAVYQVEPKFRARPPVSEEPVSGGSPKRIALRETLHATIHQDESAFVVECMELPIVSQGDDLDDAVNNFREAVSLHLEGEDVAALGLAGSPRLQIIYELPAA
jgi:predicted RNase H-like HicB family nuclease